MVPPLFLHCNLESNRPCDVRNIMADGLVVAADSNFWGITTTDQMNALSNPDPAHPEIVIKSNCSFNVPRICDAQDSLGSAIPSVTFCWWADNPYPNFSTSGQSAPWDAPPARAR